MSHSLVYAHRFVRDFRQAMRDIERFDVLGASALVSLSALASGLPKGAPKTLVQETIADLLGGLHAQDGLLFHKTMDLLVETAELDTMAFLGKIMTYGAACRERTREGWPVYDRRARMTALYALRGQTFAPEEAALWLSTVGPDRQGFMGDRILLMCVPGMEATSPQDLVETLLPQLALSGALHWPAPILNLHAGRPETAIRAMLVCLQQRLPEEMKAKPEYQLTLSAEEQEVVKLWRALGGQPDPLGLTLLTGMLSAPRSAPDCAAGRGCGLAGK